MPGREFPGIVVQGDPLSNLFDQICYSLQDAKQRQNQEAYYGFLLFAEMIQKQLLHYEETLDELKIQRPYFLSIRQRLVKDDYDS
ncbi:MAG: hypothetical protein NW220_00045 [Leptolyngbyaceae cyanobacterium bins.349]|nr:hypothetical protein [Leptolyngbyaceae cyanobacterium bins.349]